MSPYDDLSIVHIVIALAFAVAVVVVAAVWS